MALIRFSGTRLLLAGTALAVLSACDEPLDFDLRDKFGERSLDTTDATLQPAAPRPRADRRGVISYPNYQVAVARRGDRLQDVADRIGLDALSLGEYNGLKPSDPLREGEVVVLPGRVREPSPETGGVGVIQSPGGVDISSLAGNAIDNAAIQTDTLPPAPAAADAPKGPTGIEPIRHQVQRGETAFSIARLYNVSVRSLAEWNGLGSDFTIRENQILLIPPIAATHAQAEIITQPGEGSPTPTPPSAKKPLPEETVVVTEAPQPKTPDLQQSTNSAQMAYPVKGKIIRSYAKGKNNGIDIAAASGSPVSAAAGGKVAAITEDAETGAKIVVIRHPDNLMTVYYNVSDVAVSKGSTVSRGGKIASVPSSDSYVHFEVRKGFDSVDPMPFLQ